jgi:L-galactose dehydrogenase
MLYRALGATGLHVSALGFGASPLGGVFAEIDENEGRRAVRAALDLGINFFDVSPFYGNTRAERVLGDALAGVPRERYFLATKVGRYGTHPSDFDYTPERVYRSVDESLSRLGVEYVDLIQCHDIEFADLRQIVEETIPALRRIVTAGKARFIGITGLPLKIFPEIIEKASVDTILSYCHCTLNDTSLERLLFYFQGKNIGVINAAPLAMGLLTQPGPPSWHPATAEIRSRCKEAVDYCRERGVDMAKLAIQFAMARTGIATNVVGMCGVDEVVRDVRWSLEPPDEELLGDVIRILSPIRNHTWPSGRPENN